MFSRILATSLSIILFCTNAAFSYTAQTNLWAERGANRNLLKPAMASATPPQRPLPHPEPFLPFEPHFTKLLDALKHAHGRTRSTVMPKNWNKTIVVHIQDIHQNAEAQTNIGHSLENIFQTRQVGLLALEGTSASINLDRFRNFSDQKTLREVSDYFLRQGEMAGSIHAALVSPEIPTIAGIDDTAHYQANVAAFKASSPLIENARQQINALQTDLKDKKRHMFSRELYAFDQRVEGYRHAEISLSDYLGLLTSGDSNLPLQLELFRESVRMESKINFKTVEQERTKLITQLLEKLNAEQTEALTLESQRYRLGQVTAADFYLFLQNLCNDVQLALNSYPAFDTFVRYTLMADSIDMETVMCQMETLEDIRYAEFQPTTAEKTLLEESHYLHLALKLIDYSLSSKEWQEYKETEKTLNLSSFEKFYEEAEARDTAMAANLLAQMGDTQSSAAVLVTGGFHSDGITKRLANAGVATIKFVPTLTKINSNSESGAASLSVFNQDKGLLDQIFEGTKLFLSVDPTAVLPKVAGVTAAHSPAGPELLRNTPVHVQNHEISGQGITAAIEAKKADDGAIIDVKISRVKTFLGFQWARTLYSDWRDFMTNPNFQSEQALLNFPTVITACVLVIGLAVGHPMKAGLYAALIAGLMALPAFLEEHLWPSQWEKAVISFGYSLFAGVTLVSPVLLAVLGDQLTGEPWGGLLGMIAGFFVGHYAGMTTHFAFNKISPIPASRNAPVEYGVIPSWAGEYYTDIEGVFDLEKTEWKNHAGIKITKKDILDRVYLDGHGKVEGKVTDTVYVARSRKKIVGVLFGVRANVKDDLSDMPTSFDGTVNSYNKKGNTLFLYSSSVASHRGDGEEILKQLTRLAKADAKKKKIEHVITYAPAHFFAHFITLNPKFHTSQFRTKGEIDAQKVFAAFKKSLKGKKATFAAFKNFFTLSPDAIETLKKEGTLELFQEVQKRHHKSSDIAPSIDDIEFYLDLNNFKSFEDFARFHIEKIGDRSLAGTHKKFGANYFRTIPNFYPDFVISAGAIAVMLYEAPLAKLPIDRKAPRATQTQAPLQVVSPNEKAVLTAIDNGHAFALSNLTGTNLEKLFRGSALDVAERLIDPLHIHDAQKKEKALAILTGHLAREPLEKKDDEPSFLEKLHSQLENLQATLQNMGESNVSVRIILSQDLLFLDGRQMLALSTPQAITLHTTTLQAALAKNKKGEKTNDKGLRALLATSLKPQEGLKIKSEDTAAAEALWLDAAREEGLSQNRVFTNVNGIAVIPVLQIFQEEGILDMFMVGDHDHELKMIDIAQNSKRKNLRKHSIITLQELGGELDGVENYEAAQSDTDNLGNISKGFEVLVSQGFFTTRGRGKNATFEPTPLGYKVFSMTRAGLFEEAVKATRLMRQLHSFVRTANTGKAAEALETLKKLLVLQKAGWNIQASPTGLMLDQHMAQHMRRLTDGMLATSCIAAVGMPNFERDGASIKEVGPDVLRFFKNESRSFSLADNGPLGALKLNLPLVRAIFDVFESLGYVVIDREKNVVTLTTFGQEILRIDSSVGVPEAYRLLSEPNVIRHLFTGIPYPLRLDLDKHMQEFGRVLDIWGSTRQHDSNYAVAAREMMRIMFNLPLDQQPAGTLDVGGGDGHNTASTVEWLIMETSRGRALQTHPLIAIITDFNPAALGRQEQTLRELKIKLQAKFILANALLAFDNGRKGDTWADVRAIVTDAIQNGAERAYFYALMKDIGVEELASMSDRDFEKADENTVIRIITSVFSGNRKKTWFLDAYRDRHVEDIEQGVQGHVLQNDVTDVADLDKKIRELNILHPSAQGKAISRADFTSTLGFLVEERGLNIIDRENKNVQAAIDEAEIKATNIFVARIRNADRKKLWAKIKPMIDSMEYKEGPATEKEFLDENNWSAEKVAQLVMAQYTTPFAYKGRFVPGFIEAADGIVFLNQLVRGARFPTIVLDQHTPRFTPSYQKKTQQIPSHLQTPLFSQQSSAASYRWTQGMSHQWIPSREEDELTMFLAGVETQSSELATIKPVMYPTPGKSGKPVVISVTPMMPAQNVGPGTIPNDSPLDVVSAPANLKFLIDVAFGKKPTQADTAQYKTLARLEAISMGLLTVFTGEMAIVAGSAMLTIHIATLAGIGKSPYLKNSFFLNSLVYLITFGTYTLLGYFSSSTPSTWIWFATAVAVGLHINMDNRYFATLPKARSLGVNEAGPQVRVVELSQTKNLERVLLPVLADLNRFPELRVAFKVAPTGDDSVNMIAAAVIRLISGKNVPRDRMTFNISGELALDTVLAEAHSGRAQTFANGLWKNVFAQQSARIELIKTTDRWTPMSGTLKVGNWLNVQIDQVLQVLFNMDDATVSLDTVIQGALTAMKAA